MDLSTDQYLGIQTNLLLEQLELLGGCELGRRLVGSRTLTSVEDFRNSVPLTTYDDYAYALLERREDLLPAKPVLWQRTSGASDQYPCKWAPITQRMYEEMGTVVVSILILATARFKGDISFGEGENMLYALAPPPYATGCWGRRAAEELPIRFLPPLDDAENMTFEERLAQALRMGLDSGIELAFGLPSVLVAIGEQIGENRLGASELFGLARKPRAALRAALAMIKARLARRPLLPRDLWRLRGVATAGTDASLYRQRIQRLWGRTPLDVYGSTEGLVMALQAWDYQDMTFVPYFNFLEFLPEGEGAERVNGHGAKTLLLHELEVGKNYEVVITNFHGGPFVRYRIGDMVTVTSLENERLGIRLPQVRFYSRCDGILDLGGFARLTEKTIGEAVNRTGIPYAEWTARKEVHGSSLLHLYIELKENGLEPDQVRSAIHHELKQLDQPYAEMETLLRVRPLELTVLPTGTFAKYIAAQRENGADLAHIKPPHVNPSDEVLRALLEGLPAEAREDPALASVG